MGWCLPESCLPLLLFTWKIIPDSGSCHPHLALRVLGFLFPLGYLLCLFPLRLLPITFSHSFFLFSFTFSLLLTAAFCVSAGRYSYAIRPQQIVFSFSAPYIYILREREIYIYRIKIKEKQQVGLKGPKFSANAFLGGLFLTSERG